MDREVLLKQLWDEFSFDEIIDAGFEYDKICAAHLITAAGEFESETEKDFIVELTNLCENTPKKDLPYGDQVMNVLTDYFNDSTLIEYFDNDRLIERLDGSFELDQYIEDQIQERDCCEEVDDYTFADYTKEVEAMPNYKLKNFLCDLVMANHHISNDELMKLLKEKIS